MLGPGDDVILEIPGKLGEIGAVPGDADQQAAVIFRALLGRFQGFPVKHIELNMPELEIPPGFNKIDQLLGAFLALNAGRAQFDVEETGGVFVPVIILGGKI
jgi:hypothetical protein